MNKEKEIGELWFELYRTQAILSDLIDGKIDDNKVAKAIAWELLSNRFPGRFVLKDEE